MHTSHRTWALKAQLSAVQVVRMEAGTQIQYDTEPQVTPVRSRIS